ncbi:MAG: plasmid pRiA4b ORF-3 family protein [Deltaproteobacteria bacterium]|nr:plasmid pRiA4b ORF-3 family protein [Deltaproteobacteria bacterium]
MEIYTLTISFPYDEDEETWSKTIEVKEDFTLQDLHQYIQEIVDFDNDHLYEFYIGKNPRNRARTIPNERKLNEIYPMTGYKIYYLFDFGDSWLFQIKKSRKKKTEEKQKKYPVLIEHTGVNPEQYPD